MHHKLKRGIEQIIPFLILGIAIALIIGFFVMLSYVLIWGLLLGMVIWIGAKIKNYFFSAKHSSKSRGRIIDHDKM